MKERFSIELIMRYQFMLVSHLENTLKIGRTDEHTFTRLKSQGYIAQAHDEILDHFERILHELLAYYQDWLRERIVKGAEFMILFLHFRSTDRTSIIKVRQVVLGVEEKWDGII
ncbi:hypothetical protein [Paenibacillus illinoisensis]|uniref:hypothetical protein n=1 Tax=Paenibacillus illinoisensis TaxID=59845 RepID=UPI001C8E7EEB|nr:hypothetical protein [Paenibacillus illinoisensis]MBY0217845.1 hypothetical protein [Paenibacillus illinoisensis]